MKLTSEQIEKIKLCYLRWQGTVAPCGINHVDVYNPCLPEDLGGKLFCCTCGQQQVLELECSSKPGSSNGRAALLQSADKGSIPLSGT